MPATMNFVFLISKVGLSAFLNLSDILNYNVYIYDHDYIFIIFIYIRYFLYLFESKKARLLFQLTSLVVKGFDDKKRYRPLLRRLKH